MAFFLFFLLYSLYLFTYMTILRVYPIDSLLGVPNKLSTFFISSFIIVGYLLCAETISLNFNVRLFIYLSIAFCILPSLNYIHIVGVNFFQNSEWSEVDNYIPPLTMSYANVSILVLALLFYDEMSDYKIVNYLLLFFIVISVSYIMITVTKRGPFLWGFVNFAICSYFKSKNVLKYVVIASIIGLIIYYNFSTILNWISSIAPYTGERIYRSVYEGDTAKRFDLQNQGESNYILGFNQFLTSPLLGSYFRTITSNVMFKGVYPHNIFIEMLMTMGLLGFIPFMYLLKKGFQNIKHYAKKLNCHQMACFSLFLAAFLQLQTTGTIVLNIKFWLFFYIIMIVKPINTDVRVKMKEKIKYASL